MDFAKDFCMLYALPLCRSFPEMLVLRCQQPASRHCLGREEGQQRNQVMPEQFASTNKKVAELYQKVLYGIHAAKIIELVACGKFT